MLASDTLLIPVADIYSTYSASGDKKGDYLAKARKKLKIAFDSLNEQVVESIFSQKPKNNLNALQIINQSKAGLTNSADIAVIDFLSKVLTQYHLLADRAYIDHAQKLTPLFIGDMKKLWMLVALHPSFTGSTHASRLRTILHDGK